jgi:protein TonB
LVSLAVGSDGTPRNMRVTRSLGRGLDEKAIESVSQWRFDPGLKVGVPVAVGPLTVAVNFRLP